MSKLIFLRPELSDYERIKDMLSAPGEYSCILSFANILIWRDAYSYEIATYNGSVFIKIRENGTELFSLPIGGDFEVGMKVLYEYVEENGCELRLWAADGKAFELFRSKYAKDFRIEEIRANFEYVYSTKQLIELAGKKYHAKRNHVSAFRRLYKWEYEPLNEDNLDDVCSLLKKWYKENEYKNDDDMEAEKRGLRFLLQNAADLGAVGAIIRVDGAPAAFTVGCPVNEKVFDILAEKALQEYVGAYSFINNEFARRELQGYEYINREDDLGLEGLRKAKLSYHPDMLLGKYICIQNDVVKKDAKELFLSSFDDEDEKSAELFMSAFYHTGIFEYEGSRLASMLYLLPASCDGEPMLYVYGAATREEFRKQGRMTRLLEAAKKLAAEKECAALFLRPFDKNAERLYKNNGFEYNRYVTVFEMEKDGREESNCEIRSVVSSAEYEKIRNAYLCKGDIKWSVSAIRLAMENSSNAACSAFIGQAGYAEFCAICEKRGDTLLIRELFCDSPQKACRALMNHTGCAKCIALLRADEGGLPHTMECRLDGKPVERKGYTGIALD